MEHERQKPLTSQDCLSLPGGRLRGSVGGVDSVFGGGGGLAEGGDPAEACTASSAGSEL